jgi:hypothetical protein
MTSEIKGDDDDTNTTATTTTTTTTTNNNNNIKKVELLNTHRVAYRCHPVTERKNKHLERIQLFKSTDTGQRM